MSTEPMDKQFKQWIKQSDCLFGEAAEMDSVEAQELLRTAGMDPERLKSTLYRRMLERSEKYSEAGRPLPPLVKAALEDLQPGKTKDSVAGTAKLAMTHLLKEIRELPIRLNADLRPAFMAAYRNKKELSVRDKKVLDGLAESLQKRIEDHKPHE